MQPRRRDRALSRAASAAAAIAFTTLTVGGLASPTEEAHAPARAATCTPERCGSALSSATRAGRASAGAARSARPHRRSRPTTTARPAAPAPDPWQTTVADEHLFAPIVAATSADHGGGLVMVGADGGVFPVGEAGFFGSMGGRALLAPVTAAAGDPATGGYWLVGSDGGVFAFHAPYFGGLSPRRLSAPIVAMAATPDGGGYWLVGSDGGVFAFGDARYFGSGSGRGMAVRAVVPSADGRGYWLVGAAGGVLSCGDAPRVSYTSPPPQTVATASLRPIRPVVRSTLRGYPSGSSGFDVSQYQCGELPVAAQQVAVVQVTDGHLDSPPNPCYLQEALWAGPDMSAYVYMDGLPSPAPASAADGPGGACAPADRMCQSYNYGWNWARHWLAYSRSVGVYPRLWWVDVEPYSGWNGVASNERVISGAIAALRAGGSRVGVYSTPDQWAEITGGLALPGVPLWVPGAGNLRGPGMTAQGFCRSGRYAFGGGRVSVVQFGYQGSFPGTYTGPAVPFDRDYAC
jgi:hypothetical protein